MVMGYFLDEEGGDVGGWSWCYACCCCWNGGGDGGKSGGENGGGEEGRVAGQGGRHGCGFGCCLLAVNEEGKEK